MTDELIVNLVVAGAAAGGLVLCTVLWFIVVLRQLDRSWRQMQEHRRELEAALKERGNLIPQLIEVTRHRLTGERDTLEGLSHLRTKSIGGRTPPEKARAEAELDRALARILRAAGKDPGLSGVSEFESVRQSLASAARAIGEAAQAYNESAQDYNRRAGRFPGSFLAGLSGTRSAEFYGSPLAPQQAAGGSAVSGSEAEDRAARSA